ncbi:MAG TPA: DUF5343 domain-containing protein [Acidimicrobiales bacterium]|nr:DUF5343 domain-containing protein [Acidimicrobiales bacterium]
MLEAVNPRPLADDERRPYAPAANVVGLLERIRRRNLPDVIDPDFMRIAGIPEGTMGRVGFALRFLELTDDAGRPTDRLRAIARADDEEFRELLAAVLREAYAADFARIDPAQDTQARIVSAFQRYEPRSQTERMVMLFLGMVRAAGLPVLEAPRERAMQPVRVTPRPIAVRRVSTIPRPRTPNPVQDASIRGASTAPADNLVFGVTIEDIGALPPDEFTEVWNALGKIAQARARSLKALSDMSQAAADRNRAEQEEEPKRDQ